MQNTKHMHDKYHIFFRFLRILFKRKKIEHNFALGWPRHLPGWPGQARPHGSGLFYKLGFGSVYRPDPTQPQFKKKKEKKRKEKIKHKKILLQQIRPNTIADQIHYCSKPDTVANRPIKIFINFRLILTQKNLK